MVCWLPLGGLEWPALFYAAASLQQLNPGHAACLPSSIVVRVVHVSALRARRSKSRTCCASPTMPASVR